MVMRRYRVKAALLAAALTVSGLLPGGSVSAAQEHAVSAAGIMGYNGAAGFAASVNRFDDGSDKSETVIANVIGKFMTQDQAAARMAAEAEVKEAAQKAAIQAKLDAEEAARQAEENLQALKKKYKNICVAQVKEGSWVNVRSKASASARIVGVMFNNAAGTIEETVKKSGGNWYKIRSGKVEGYVKAKYFIKGLKVAEIAQDISKLYCQIESDGVKVYKKADETSKALGKMDRDELLLMGERNIVGKGGTVFCKVDYENKSGDNVSGYIVQDDVTIIRYFERAEAVVEEKKESGDVGDLSNLGTDSNSVGEAMAAYAQRYCGILPYVWGGTSLTNGADCSGFCQAIYKRFGYSIPRTSRQQAAAGRPISASELQPGDLVFYSARGLAIGHVAMYIGNGMIVNEANSYRDCCVQTITFNGQPVKFVTFLH